MSKENINEYAYGLAAEIDDHQIDLDEAIEILVEEYRIPFKKAEYIMRTMMDNS